MLSVMILNLMCHSTGSHW